MGLLKKLMKKPLLAAGAAGVAYWLYKKKSYGKPAYGGKFGGVLTGTDGAKYFIQSLDTAEGAHDKKNVRVCTLSPADLVGARSAASGSACTIVDGGAMLDFLVTDDNGNAGLVVKSNSGGGWAPDSWLLSS